MNAEKYHQVLIHHEIPTGKHLIHSGGFFTKVVVTYINHELIWVFIAQNLPVVKKKNRQLMNKYLMEMEVINTSNIQNSENKISCVPDYDRTS